MKTRFDNLNTCFFENSNSQLIWTNSNRLSSFIHWSKILSISRSITRKIKTCFCRKFLSNFYKLNTNDVIICSKYFLSWYNWFNDDFFFQFYTKMNENCSLMQALRKSKKQNLLFVFVIEIIFSSSSFSTSMKRFIQSKKLWNVFNQL